MNGRKGGKPKGWHGKQARTLMREAGRAKALHEEAITAERTMREIARLAFTSRSTMWRDGRLLPFEEWPADAVSLLAGFEVIKKNAAGGDGHTDTVHKVQFERKLGALEMLAKHFGLITDRHEVTLIDRDIEQRLLRGRQRNAEGK